MLSEERSQEHASVGGYSIIALTNAAQEFAREGRFIHCNTALQGVLTCLLTSELLPECQVLIHPRYAFSSLVHVAPAPAGGASLGPAAGFLLQVQVFCCSLLDDSGTLHYLLHRCLLDTHRNCPCCSPPRFAANTGCAVRESAVNLGEGFCSHRTRPKQQQSSRQP